MWWSPLLETLHIFYNLANDTMTAQKPLGYKTEHAPAGVVLPQCVLMQVDNINIINLTEPTSPVHQQIYHILPIITNANNIILFLNILQIWCFCKHHTGFIFVGQGCTSRYVSAAMSMSGWAAKAVYSPSVSHYSTGQEASTGHLWSVGRYTNNCPLLVPSSAGWHLYLWHDVV